MGLSRKQILNPQVISVEPFLERVSMGLRTLLGSSVMVSLKVESPDLRVKVDPIECEQMILNLCINARDAMSGGGKISIRVARVELDAAYVRDHANVTPGTFVLFEVSDNGHGMDKETLGKIFEPFFTTKSAGRGTGLGLALVQGFVQQCNGHVWVYSEPGMGTSVKIYVPATDQTEAADLISVNPSSGTLRGTEPVLLVEDDPTLGQALARTLSTAGYQILSATSEAEAEDLLSRNPNLKLLITDTMIGSGNGFSLAQKARRVLPEIRVIHTTGYAVDLLQVEQALQAKMVLLRKPIMIGDLLRTVRGVMDGAIAQAIV